MESNIDARIQKCSDLGIRIRDKLKQMSETERNGNGHVDSIEKDDDTSVSDGCND